MDTSSTKDTSIAIRSQEMDRICHELRKPLSAMRAFADLLLDEVSGPLNDAQRDYVETVLRNADDLAALVDDLGEVAACLTDESAPCAAGADLEVVLSDVQDAAAERFAEAGVRLSLVTPGPLQHPAVDVAAVSSALARVLDNCLAFARTGTVTLSLTRTPDGARVTVEDQGPGLPDGQEEAAFEAFRRFRRPDAHVDDGMGVGLAIARAHVARSGGTIRAENKNTGGACITVELPFPEASVVPASSPTCSEGGGL